MTEMARFRFLTRMNNMTKDERNKKRREVEKLEHEEQKIQHQLRGLLLELAPQMVCFPAWFAVRTNEQLQQLLGDLDSEKSGRLFRVVLDEIEKRRIRGSMSRSMI
jgi:hypothetical protein